MTAEEQKLRLALEYAREKELEQYIAEADNLPKPSHRSHCEGATKRPWQSLQWRLANRYALGALLHGSCKPNQRFGQLLNK